MRHAIFAILGLTVAPQMEHTGVSNQTTPAQPPQILVSARGEVKVTPDRASIHISVQTRGGTATIAATENARRQQAVVAAIRALGIPQEHIGTQNYNVSPEYRYDQNQPPVVTGYVVTNTVAVDVRDLTKVPRVIDASLAAGANVINSLEFYASNADVARREAIATAVARARADAEVAARAARGSIGSLLEITIGSYGPPPPRPMYTMSKAANQEMAMDTPISPGQQSLTVDVTTRWAFIMTQ